MAQFDPGLQPERTALAWKRTGLALLVNALAVLRSGWMSQQTSVLTLGAVLLLASAATVAGGSWRARQLTGSAGPGAPPTRLMAGLLILVWLACAAGVWSMAAPLLAGGRGG
jgi:uncharacterized membrane protein YidH (DUF202 family)